MRRLKQHAADAGNGRSSLYKALADDGNSTIDTVMKLLDGLMIKLRAQPNVTAARRAGYRRGTSHWTAAESGAYSLVCIGYGGGVLRRRKVKQ